MVQIVGVGRLMCAPKKRGAAGVARPFDSLVSAGITFKFLHGGQRLLSSYSGNGYGVTRTSDNTSQVFAVGATAATIKAWRDAIGASVATLTDKYDQTGNGYTVTGHCTLDLDSGLYPEELYVTAAADRFPITSPLDFAASQAGVALICLGKLNTPNAGNTFIGFSTGAPNGSTGTPRVFLSASATAFRVSSRTVDNGTTTTTTHATFDTTNYHRLQGRWKTPTTSRQSIVVDGVITNAAMSTNVATFPSGVSIAAAEGAGVLSGVNQLDGKIMVAGGIQRDITDAEVALIDTALAACANPSVVAPVLAIKSTQQDRVWPVSGDVGPNGTVTFAGTYTGTTTAIEVKIFKASDNSLVVDWTNISATISGGAWSGTLTTVPAGTPGVKYYAKARKTDDTANVVTETTTWMVGARVLKLGQSNIQKDSSGTSGSAPTALTGCYRDIGGGYYVVDLPARTGEPTTLQGANGAGGDGDIEFCNRLSVALNMNVCVVNVAIVGTAQTTWLTAANGGSHTSWDNLLAVLARAEIGTDFNCAIYYQGEADAVLATTKATFKTGLTNIAAQLRTLTGRASMKIFWVPPAYDTSATAGNMDPIRQGHIEFCDTNASGFDFLAAVTVDLVAALDGTHFNAAQRPIFNRRYAATIATKFLGTGNGGYGAKFAATLTASAATQKITLPVTQNGGTALRDSAAGTSGAGLTGFRAFVNGASKTISTTAFNGNNIELTLAALSFIATDTIAVDYLYDQPTVTSVVYDNLPLTGDSLPGRPLQPTRGQISAAAGA